MLLPLFVVLALLYLLHEYVLIFLSIYYFYVVYCFAEILEMVSLIIFYNLYLFQIKGDVCDLFYCVIFVAVAINLDLLCCDYFYFFDYDEDINYY